jgi:ketopantoate reductase
VMTASDPVLGISGAGSLRQTHAGRLAAGGQAVTVLATKATADRLVREGALHITGVVPAHVL